MNQSTANQGQEKIIRLVRLARAFEAGGIYNGAKLLRALAFAEETRLSEPSEQQLTPEWIDRETGMLIQELSQAGSGRELLEALGHARLGASENRTILLEETPPVFVCRFCGALEFHQAPESCPGCGARALSFREFLPYYYLEPLAPELAIEVLQATAQEVTRMATGLSEQQMSHTPRPGEWAIRNLLWHLLVAQQLLAGRVDKMLAEETPSLKSLAAWAEGGEGDFSGQQIVGRYLQSRQATLERLRAFAPQDWLRCGLHDEFGKVTIIQQTSYFARHDQYHLPQLKKLTYEARGLQK